MIDRTRALALVLLLALTLVAPALARQATPIPAPTPIGPSATTQVPVPTRAARPTRPSTPEPGPLDQPGLFASDARLLARDRTGPFLRGDDDQFAVVGTIPDDSGNDVLVALRNNTSNEIQGAELTATLRDPGTGAPIALGITSDIAPAMVVPGGLAFALITLEGANGRISERNLPHIDVRESTHNSQVSDADLRLVSATVTERDVLAAVAVDSGSVSAFQMVVVCVRQVASHALGVRGWTSSVTLYEVQLEAGDTTTLRTDPPTNCGGRFIVAVASF